MSKDSCNDGDKDRHTLILEDGADTLQRVEIITGTGRRRRWSTDAKGAIVAESFAPGASVSAVARRHDISPSLLFVRRRERRSRSAGPETCHLALCRSRSPAAGANCRRARSRRQSRSRSARFASVSGGRSTGGRCARCWRRSGRLADDRAATRVVDLDRDAAGRFPSRHGLACDAGERGVWSRSVRWRTLHLPLQARPLRFIMHHSARCREGGQLYHIDSLQRFSGAGRSLSAPLSEPLRCRGLRLVQAMALPS